MPMPAPIAAPLPAPPAPPPAAPRIAPGIAPSTPARIAPPPAPFSPATSAVAPPAWRAASVTESGATLLPAASTARTRSAVIAYVFLEPFDIPTPIATMSPNRSATVAAARSSDGTVAGTTARGAVTGLSAHAPAPIPTRRTIAIALLWRTGASPWSGDGPDPSRVRPRSRTFQCARRRAGRPRARNRPATLRRQDGRGCELPPRERLQVGPETRHRAEVGVAHEVLMHPAGDGIHAHPLQRRRGKQQVGAPVDRVLEKAMDQDDVGSGDARSPPDRLPDEAPVVDDQLEIQLRDVATGAARAALVTRQFALLRLEHGERVREQGRQNATIGQRSVGADGEHRVSLELLDLQRRCEPPHHRLEEDAGDLRAVFQ